jgi:hypothetical protein
MQRLLLATLALLCLIPVADVLHARQGPAVADKKEEALKRLEQLAKELDQLEQQISEERIKARKELVEQEQRVRLLDRAGTAQSKQLATEVQNLEKQLREIEAVAVPGKEPNRIVAALKLKIDELRVQQEKQLIQTAQAREECMVAEEKFRYLERKHDNQRRFLNLKIELVEQELFGKTEGADRRKQEKLEKGLETIQRDLEELRRKLESKDALKP